MGTVLGSLQGPNGDPQSGGAGTNFKAGYAQIQPGVTQAQIDQSYANSQQGLSQQQSFLQAVQAQNGLQNQSDTYNQLQGVANGTGANPAQAQLAQATQANVANQAALMAGQRGSSANAGLLARQASMQGANTQQQAAGQAATLQANQSLNALNSMGSLATSQANQQANATNAYSAAAQNEQGTLLGNNAAFNNAQVGSQSSANSSNATISTQTAQGQQGILGGIFGAIGGAFSTQAEGGMVGRDGMHAVQKFAGGGQVQGGTTQLQQTPSGPQSSFGKFFQGFANSQQNQGGGAVGAKSLNSGSSQLGGGLAKYASQAYNYFTGPDESPYGGQAFQYNPDQSQWGQTVDSMGTNTMADLDANAAGADGALGSAGTTAGGAADAVGTGAAVGEGATATEGVAGMASLGEASDLAVLAAAKGGKIPPKGPQITHGKVPTLVSPGEKVLTPAQAKQVAAGKASPMRDGATVPGKPNVPGAKNSYANDTVPAKLDAGTIVIPRSVTQGKDAEKRAIEFVRQVMAKNAMKPKGK